MHHSILPCDFALPAEWEPQSAIMLTWPHGGTDWKPYLRQITNTYLQLADIITRYEDLLVVTPILESTQRMLAEKLSEGQMSRVHLYEMDTNDTWARDHGPISMVSRGRHNSHVIPIHLLDFTTTQRERRAVSVQWTEPAVQEYSLVTLTHFLTFQSLTFQTAFTSSRRTKLFAVSVRIG